ncbi:MAG: hypothetical protein HY390_05820 [Deltaproteobacteria bacterium]|nr:hypothetical protein [Deltaproteobacteria bacterium]
MVTTTNRRFGKKKSEAISETLSKDNTDQKINDNEYIIEGRVVKTPPESKEVLEMADDDPRILKMMENNLKKWKKKYPNVTREEIDRKLDEMLASEKELRKKSLY